MSEPLSNEKKRLRLWQMPLLLLSLPLLLTCTLLSILWQVILTGWAFGQFTYEQFVDSLPERHP